MCALACLICCIFREWLARLLTPLPIEGIFDEFDRKVDRLLTERGRAPDAEPKDLLARLIAARDDETGGGMTAKEVRDQVVTIFMAGHETTSLALIMELVSAVAASGGGSKIAR